MSKRNRFYLSTIGIWIGLCASFLTACSVDLNTKKFDKTHFYFIDSPNQRLLDPDTYFKHEYKYINSRNGSGESEARPKHLLGLTFSGGGIRSAAFQLGILSGLHSSEKGNVRFLSKIDYISSVSGGSWANGSYWSTSQSDDQFFSCLNEYAETGVPKTGCKPPSDKLRNTQEISALLRNDEGEIEKRKLTWEKDIIDAHLGDCNIDFDAIPRKGFNPDKVAPCRQASISRPYPIFNSTHSSSKEKASVDHYPFESTPDYQGTIIDDKGYRGFFLKSGSANFLWENRDWKRLIPGGIKDHPGEVLSLMLAHSSGVAGKSFLLQYNFHAHYQDNETKGSAIKGLRDKYKLADGGKSDNLGLVPLLERGVETIIVSQMGKEGEDFEDIKLAAKQADKLFGITFKSDWERDVQPVVTTSYKCQDVSKCGQRKGTLILIRPTVQNVSKFLDELRKQNPKLHSEIEELNKGEEKEKDHFPETPTFRKKYEPELIRAYFLLGRYLAETSVRDALISLNSVQ